MLPKAFPEGIEVEDFLALIEAFKGLLKEYFSHNIFARVLGTLSLWFSTWEV
jgi:hypothetical protein